MPFLPDEDNLNEAVSSLKDAIRKLETTRNILTMHPRFREEDVLEIEKKARVLLDNVMGELDEK